MSEYKSPINVTFEDISNEVINGYDNEIVCSVKKITEIDVDKKRLINALLLDKNLVRCKDCKYWDNMPVPTKIRGGTYCIKSSELMDADDFCSRGEKR